MTEFDKTKLGILCSKIVDNFTINDLKVIVGFMEHLYNLKENKKSTVEWFNGLDEECKHEICQKIRRGVSQD